MTKTLTVDNVKENYATISSYFDGFFRLETDPTGFDLAKLTYYITYLLDRVSIVEIRIERQDNVDMIFEVVNDRGLGLKPYEILNESLRNKSAAECRAVFDAQIL